MNLLDQQLFQWIGAGFTPDTSLLWLAARLAVGTSWVMAGAIAVAAWRRPGDRLYILAASLTAVFAGMLAHEIAAALMQPRPFMLGLSPSWIPHGNRGSLPSAHASVMFTIALGFLYRPRLRVIGGILAGLALITGWARVYVGVHFPMDVAAGLLLGGTLAVVPALASRWLRSISPGRRFPPEIGLARRYWTTSSIRRFLARPLPLWFETTGERLPIPSAVKRSRAIP